MTPHQAAARLLAQTGSEKLRQAPMLQREIAAALVRAERRGKATGMRDVIERVHQFLPMRLVEDLRRRAAACEEGTG